MSTRANILLKDNDGNKLWYYQHSDGYPEGVMPTLDKLKRGLDCGAIRNNLGQAAGWLILFGAKVMAEDTKESEFAKNESSEIRSEPDMTDDFYGWKAGNIEPTTGMHGDIEYLYVVNVEAKTIKTISSYEKMEDFQ